MVQVYFMSILSDHTHTHTHTHSLTLSHTHKHVKTVSNVLIKQAVIHTHTHTHVRTHTPANLQPKYCDTDLYSQK